MDSNTQYQSNTTNSPRQRGNSFATASLIMGILAVLTLCTIYLPIVFGSLSIIFAVLSKGSQQRMAGASHAGIMLSLMGITLSVVTIVTTVFLLLTNPNIYQEYKKELNTIFSQQYGITYDEFMEQYQQNFE